MNDVVLGLLAWVGFSPIAGIAVGNFLRRTDERSRAHGDPAMNLRRPELLPRVVATQTVQCKPARIG